MSPEMEFVNKWREPFVGGQSEEPDCLFMERIGKQSVEQNREMSIDLMNLIGVYPLSDESISFARSLQRK